MSDQGKAGNNHVEIVVTHNNDGDIAMQMFGKDTALPEAIDPAEERRLVRKIDWFIIPLIAITYLITYIDKATLSYAALFGMRQDVGLVGMDYSWLGSIFYFGYLFFEFPTSWCMQKFSVAKWLALNIAVWGCICALLGACNSFSSLAALRFILGALESCSTPAYLLITAMWYKVEEQPIRIGVWSICLGLANAMGGLLGYGIGHIHGSLANWRYQFIIIGVISAAWGVVLFFALAESPLSARWLNEREKIIAVARLRSNQTGIKNTAFKISHVIEAFLDPKTWFLVVFGLSTQLVNGAVSNFGTLIISGFGYSTLATSLLQIPYGFLISISILGAMFLQRWLKGQMRCIVGGIFVLPSLAGIIGVHLLPQSKKGGLLACYYLTASYTASFAICMSLIIANTAGSTKRSCVSAVFFVSYCVGNIIGPFAFKSNEAPRYESGIIAILTGYCVEIFVLITFALYLAWCNKRKEQQFVELGLDFSEVEQNRMAFQDLTDRENPFFRYSY